MKKLLMIVLILLTSALIAGCRHGDSPAELKAGTELTEADLTRIV